MLDDRGRRLWEYCRRALAEHGFALDAEGEAWLRELIEQNLLRLEEEAPVRGEPEDPILRPLLFLLEAASDRAGRDREVGAELLNDTLEDLGRRWDDFPLIPPEAEDPVRGPVSRGPSRGIERPRFRSRSLRRGGPPPEAEERGWPREGPKEGTYALPGDEDREDSPRKTRELPSPSPPPPPSKRARRSRPPLKGVRREAAVGPREMTEPDPPRTAYPRLEAPEAIVAGAEIEVVAGLAEKQSPDVVGEAMTRPASSVGPYVLTVQLVADGFRLRDGEAWRRDLLVTAGAPYPSAVFHLTPEPQTAKLRPRAIQALYSVAGQTMGMALRPIVVARNAAALADAPAPAAEPGVDMSVPTDLAAPDLEVRILLDPDRPGGLLWTFMTPHVAIDVPDEPLKTDIGDHPREFTRQLVDKVNAKEGQLNLFPFLSGVGVTIADQVPPVFWDLLRAAAAQAGGPPDLLILSQEPYVPWELARVDAPLLDPEAPPFLGAQANVGRWVLGQRRPKQPPPTGVTVQAVAVVSGVYNRPGWRRLPEAEDEAARLRDDPRLRAAPVNAATAEVFACLGGVPKADLLHFAVHGIYDPQSVQDGLVLVDGQVLDPLEVKGTPLQGAPFVFLNACQVGAGNRVLGDYAGMAAAFLEAGAAGVVAPLWSVKDALAKEIALGFYAATSGGARPAAALREARKGFKAAVAPQSATHLAYQFFGHPGLKLEFAVP